MDSQASPHTSISIRPPLPQQISNARNNPVAGGYPAPSYLPVDIMMYHSTAPLVIPNPSVSPCVLTPPFFCQTCMMYSTTNNPCSVHHTPIAYGQASSSYAALNSQSAASQQVVNNPQNPTDARTSLHHPGTTVQQAVNQQRRDVIEMARQSNAPSLPNPPRSVTMRMKRGQPIPARVQQLESIAQRPAKLRRVASDGSREIQAIRAEVQQQQDNTPSTSQLVTGTVPSSHACAGSAPGQRCPPCTQCYCSHCPLSAGSSAHAHIAASSPLLLTTQGTPFASQLSAQQNLQQQQQVQQIRYVQDSMLASQMQQFYVQPHQQPAHHHHHQHPPPNPSTPPAFVVAAAAAHQAQQQQQIQQQLHHQNQLFSRLIPRSHSLFLLPARHTGVTPTGFELNTMLVNVVPSELIMDRPMLDRHHMFAPPNSEPQPVGLNSQEIDKYTEKIQFIRDVDVPEEELERCTVCQCEFETGEEIRNLACTHQFHVGCIDRWLGYNKKCPVCRVDIDQQKVVLVE
ncbi:unnamed protein product [Auanema sp. JU1783]|nr:unnamed protein product [Auanema sp. JU1783]